MVHRRAISKEATVSARRRPRPAWPGFVLGLWASVLGAGAADAQDWTHYGADAAGRRYVAADEITPANVRKLRKVWEHKTGHKKRIDSAKVASAFEATPILIDGRLIFCTPFNEIIALDPGAGTVLWRHDPQIDLTRRPANQYVCRGVTAWRDPAAAPGDFCATRIFAGTNDGRVLAVDAASGDRCTGFGEAGQVTVDPRRALIWPGEFQITSPPTVIGGLVVTGSAIADNQRVQAPSGMVRAYDARTGEARWSFDPVPRAPNDPLREEWVRDGPVVQGHTNVWSIMAADEGRDLLFLPTSSPSPDFYGGDRPGDNRYANSVVALRGSTGQVVWHYQIVHHDLWDYDLPAQPGLYEMTLADEPIPVVVQATKTGHVFVLHRETGEPVFPVVEQPVPQEPVAGEWLSPTQPLPLAPAGLSPTRLRPEDAWGISFWDRNACRDQIESLRSDGLFTPPSREGTIVYPFTGGGANWGSMAFDPGRQWVFVNTSNLAHIIQLILPEQIDEIRATYDDPGIGPQRGARYAVSRRVLLSPLGLPCNPPPWGQLHAVDLRSGRIVWQSTLGTTRDMAPMGISLAWGTPNIGGPMVTEGGLVFIGAAMDDYLRAFDANSGEELWKGRLPAGGQATPMSYVWEGRQYVVIAAGGHAEFGTRIGDSVVAFALPD